MSTKTIKATNVLRWLRQSKARINVIKGGAGSSKSHSLAQHFILNKMSTNSVNVVARKTLPSLKKTAFKLVLDLLGEYDIPYKLNKTDLELKVGASTTYFLSLDDPDKIKSLDINNVWLEEATDFTLDDFRQFKLRLRRKGDLNQMYLSFNPVSALHWIKREVVDKDKDVAVHTSTYKDNPFLDRDYIQDLEGLIDEDRNYYNIYTLGQWGVLEDLIYTSWKTVKVPESFDDVSYGLDWGYNNPSSLVKIYWVDGKVVWQELLYEAKLTQQELADRVRKLVEGRAEIFVDSAEPALIDELFKRGLNADKAKKDVVAGINACKSVLIGVTEDSPNLIKELQSYKWKQNKNSEVLDEPLKFMDHGMDAARYGTFSKINTMGRSKILNVSFR